MAKSTIIKELANNTIDTTTALKRLKVLLMDLDKPEINEWVNCELNGYNDISKVPSYRRFVGQVMASFIIGRYNMMQYTNTPLPTRNIPDNIKRLIEEVVFSESISAIKQMAGEKMEKIIPPELYGYLKQGTNISSITSAQIDIPQTIPNEIISAVENRILDILVLLEKEFGNLDELDIDTASKSPEELAKISDKIVVIVYNDYSINIGDNNKIKDTEIGL